MERHPCGAPGGGFTQLQQHVQGGASKDVHLSTRVECSLTPVERSLGGEQVVGSSRGTRRVGTRTSLTGELCTQATCTVPQKRGYMYLYELFWAR